MPQEFRDCVAGVKKSGKSESSAYAICTAQFMKKHGMTPAEAEKRSSADNESLVRTISEIFSQLSDEDLALWDDDFEYELAELCSSSVDGGNVKLVWSAPTKRKDIPDSHFFWPEEKKYPYRNSDGSINCDAVMAAWRMAHGARSGKKAPPEVISRIEPKRNSCMNKRASDVSITDYARTFEMPSMHLLSVSPQRIQFADEKEFGDDTKMIKIQMLKLGTFEHPEYGKLEFTDPMFDSFIKNFESKVPQEHIAYDYKHRPDWGAAAWVTKLFKEGDGLWATVELTRRGFESLKNKEFLYFSTEYVDNYIDRSNGAKHGPTILGGGLTNRPFIKGMAPAVLSEEGEIVLSPIVGDTRDHKPTEEEQKKMFDQILNQLKELHQKLTELQADKADEKTKEFTEALGTQITALSEKAEELKKLADDAPQIKELEEKNKKLTDEVNTLTETTKALLDQREKDNRRLYEQDVDAFAKGLEEDGFWPSTVAEVKGILLSATVRDTVVKLSEEKDGKKSETAIDLRGVIGRILESVPKEARVDLEEKTRTPDPTKANSKIMSDADVMKFADEKKISYKDALVELSKAGKLTM